MARRAPGDVILWEFHSLNQTNCGNSSQIQFLLVFLKLKLPGGDVANSEHLASIKGSVSTCSGGS